MTSVINKSATSITQQTTSILTKFTQNINCNYSVNSMHFEVYRFVYNNVNLRQNQIKSVAVNDMD